MQVSDLMTKQVITVNQTQTLDEVDSVMSKGRIRHVPVVDDNQNFVGLVTHRDLLESCIKGLTTSSVKDQKSFLQQTTIKDVMRQKVLTTTSNTSLKDAAKLMLSCKIGCLPVVENSKLVGIVTEADFLKFACQQL